MKETRFIAQNKEKWLESENLLKERVKDPEKLTNLFIQVIDDLSFSRTYYQNRSVRVYLNRLGREFFNIIYSNKKTKRNRFNAFWLDELPQIIYQSRKPLLISLVVFLFAAAIGVFSAVKDPQFTSTILGDSYVAMTKENIAKGDPMAVYKSSHQIDMFLQITVNNIRVAFTTYVFGVFLSLGTIMILLYNGIMVGCFQYFFVERGLFMESALTIWLHGTLEISSIIIAGGAGLVLGSGLIFPGTYSRLQAFQMSAIRSLKIMLGIAPIFIVAGIIESFLTRYTEVSDLLKLFLILLSAFFIIGYFVVYPWMKSRSGFDAPLEEAQLPPASDETLHYDKIKSNAEIIKDGFIYYKKFSGQLLGWIAFITLLMALSELFLYDSSENIVFANEWYRLFTGSVFYGIKTPSPVFLAINTIGTSLIIYRVNLYIDGDSKKILPLRYNVAAFLQTVMICGIFYLMLFFLGGWGDLLAIFSFVFFLLLCSIQHIESRNIFSAFSKMFAFAGEDAAKIFGLQLILLLLLFSFLTILSAPLLYYNTTILQWNFSETDTWAKEAVRFIEIYLKLFVFNLTLPILAATVSYLYFTLREISGAENLIRSINHVGQRNPKKR